ncbi:MAG: hypothetical protein ACJARR_001006 [Pseudophaeobacter arcticus]|jgi:hypothetical protein
MTSGMFSEVAHICPACCLSGLLIDMRVVALLGVPTRQRGSFSNVTTKARRLICLQKQAQPNLPGEAADTSHWQSETPAR